MLAWTSANHIATALYALRLRIPSAALITLFAVVLIFLSASAGHGYDPNYLPLSRAELAKRFPQKRIHLGNPNCDKPGVLGHLEAATIRLEDRGRTVITGTDKQGRPWEFDTEWTAGCEIFSADIDHDGRQDLIAAIPTMGNGLAPSTDLLILLFDQEGRPIPTEFDGYFTTDAEGVQDLLDLNQDGHAELLRQSFNDGYWITSLYIARGAHWYLERGQLGAYSYPLYTRFTSRPNRVPTVPKRGSHPQDADLSNGAILNQTPARIEKLKWGNVEESENPTLTLSDGRTCSPVAWYATLTVIVDSKAGRQSSTLSDPVDSKRLLETILRDRLPVRISGYRPSRDSTAWKRIECAPELVWGGTLER